jgi:hypothetical protein
VTKSSRQNTRFLYVVHVPSGTALILDLAPWTECLSLIPANKSKHVLHSLDPFDEDSYTVFEEARSPLLPEVLNQIPQFLTPNAFQTGRAGLGSASLRPEHFITPGNFENLGIGS